MCKKKNKGFTLTEIITTLVILGVLLLIAVPSYKAVMNNFKTDYYKKKSETILQTANTYFSDNKSSLPSELLQSKKIGLEDLVSKKYIDNINIYNSSNQCTGYVVKIKDTKDYITQVCMDCGEYKTYPTNFTACNDPTKSCDTRDYCNDAWIDEKNQLEYKYPDTKTTVFVHTTNETNNDKIKKLLSTSRTITKYNKEGNILKSIDDTSVVYYPDNYQSVNLTEPSKDVYTLKYKYPTGSIFMHLEVYQHSSPVLSYDNGSSNLNVSDSSTFNHYGYSNIKFQYQKENTTTWIDINGCSSLTKDHLSCSISPELPAKYRVVATTSDGVVEIGAESKLYYSLNVDLNGGSFTNFGTKYYLNKGNELNIPNPKRTSYEFTGWTLNGTGSSINNNKFTMGSKNTILTARWIENRYTLTVNPNGGSWNGTSLNTVFEGTIGTKKSIARTEGYAYPSWIGYTFAGWTLTGGGSFSASNDTYTYGIENGTLTANWTANNYTLTVNPNGGSWNGTSSSTVFEGTIGTKKSIARESGYAYPTRAGYSFTGWTRTGGGSFTSSNDTYTYGTENGTLIANWTANNYTLTVNPNGGVWNGSSSSTIFEGTMNSTKSIVGYGYPTRAGWSFTGWTHTGGGSFTSYNDTYTYGTVNGTLIANWVINDNTPPTCQINVNGTIGNNGWYKSSVTLSTTGFDEGGISSTWVEYQGYKYNSLNLDSTNTTTIIGYAKDNAGNIGSCSKTIKIDSYQPIVVVAFDQMDSNIYNNWLNNFEWSYNYGNWVYKSNINRFNWIQYVQSDANVLYVYWGGTTINTEEPFSYTSGISGTTKSYRGCARAGSISGNRYTNKSKGSWDTMRINDRYGDSITGKYYAYDVRICSGAGICSIPLYLKEAYSCNSTTCSAEESAFCATH